jgi:hypothetical protein
MSKAYLVIILLIGQFGISTCYSQNEKQPNKQTQRAEVANEEKTYKKKEQKNNVERENRKTQAISILYEVINYTEEIASFESQATIISNALNLLWKHNESYSRSNFLKALDRFFLKYSSQDTTRTQKEKVAAGIKILITNFAKHDPSQAEKAIERYRKLVEEELNQNSKLSLRDRLSIAQSSLDIDVRQSAMIAARLLDSGVPSSFPDYLYELEKRDEISANTLYRVALSKLVSSAIYNPNHSTYLSAFAFREKLLVVQIRTNSSESPRIEYASLTNNLLPSPKPFSLELAGTYLNAAYIFLEAKRIRLEQEGQLNAEYVMQCYFLAKKLNGYANRLNLNQNRQWEQLSSRYELIAQRAGFTVVDLNNLSNTAQRLVNEGSIFQFDDGASAFEKAKATKDANEKTELLVRGIHELLEAEKFAEAEQKIREIEDEKVIEQITDYFHFRASSVNIRKREWSESLYHSNKINNPQLRMYVLLEGLKASLKNGKKDIALGYLQLATNTVQKIEDKSVKAKGLAAMAGLLSSFDSTWGSQTLADAIKAINQADSYDGANYSVQITLPNMNLFFPLDNSDINSCFEQAAKSDWMNTTNATTDITRKEIRAKAQIAACRSIL